MTKLIVNGKLIYELTHDELTNWIKDKTNLEKIQLIETLCNLLHEAEDQIEMLHDIIRN